MTSRDFCYWLQGWFELNQTIDHREGASKETLEMIQKHLNLVFLHEIDPSYTSDPKKQAKMNEIHSGESNPVSDSKAWDFTKPQKKPFSNSDTLIRC